MAKKYKVALQCGHGKSTNGSWDPGTTYGKYTEASLMLPITKAAVKYLRSYGVDVISDSDTGNNKNMIVDVAWANKEKCDIYVSVHCDYYKAPSGVMPLYVSKGGKKLATCLNNAVKSGIKMKSRGVVRRTDLWELNGTNMVACILETGSIKADISILKNKTDAYGKCIADGICEYFGIKAAPIPTPKVIKPEKKELYRVRKAWNKPDTQKGAFNNLENAKICADVNGMNVYGSNGKLVYSSKKSTPSKSKPKEVKPAAAPSNAQKIVNKVYEYAWPASTKRSKYIWNGGSARPSYKAALKKYMGKSARVSQTDCGYFASTCVMGGGLAKPKKFNCLKFETPSSMKIVLSGRKIPDGFLQPGDLVRYKKKTGQHALISLGNGKIAEAQRSSGKKGLTFPHITKDTKKYNKSNVRHSTLQVLRAK